MNKVRDKDTSKHKEKKKEIFKTERKKEEKDGERQERKNEWKKRQYQLKRSLYKKTNFLRFRKINSFGSTMAKTLAFTDGIYQDQTAQNFDLRENWWSPL